MGGLQIRRQRYRHSVYLLRLISFGTQESDTLIPCRREPRRLHLHRPSCSLNQRGSEQRRRTGADPGSRKRFHVFARVEGALQQHDSDPERGLRLSVLPWVIPWVLREEQPEQCEREEGAGASEERGRGLVCAIPAFALDEGM